MASDLQIGTAMNSLRSKFEIPRSFGVGLVVFGALAIAVATLTPAPEPVDPLIPPPLSCLMFCGDLGGTDIALNLLLFVPFAAGLALLGIRSWRVFLVAFLLSLTIEMLQIKVIPGRDASVSDLVSNSTGALLAAWLTNWRVVWLIPNRRQAAWLTVVALSAWIVLEIGTAWSLQPSLPRTAYWGQWAPNLGFLDQFKGRVLGAVVAGDSLPPHQLADSDRLRQRLLQGAGMVTARAFTGRPPEDLAPIVSVFDGRYTEIFLLGQRRDEAFFRLRTRVSLLKLRPPAIIIPHAIPLESDRPVTLTGGYVRGRYSLRIETSGGTIERTLAMSPNLGWSYFMPWGNYALGENVRWLTALWVGGLLFPIGYWAGRSGMRAGPLAAWLLIGLTLTLVPRIFELPPIHPSEWGAAALGLILGQGVVKWVFRVPLDTEPGPIPTAERRAAPGEPAKIPAPVSGQG